MKSKSLPIKNQLNIQLSSNIRSKNKLIIWTFTLCLMIIVMIVIGGVTRLTGSGLSIVEWKPLMGAIPPLNLEDWNEVFAKYKTSPQYEKVNFGMTLSEFQWIYFWEYFHRLIGRLLGVVFFIPWVIFWVKKDIDKKRAFKYLLGFLLGGLQALMGWVMVASGLVNQPQVSHFRLAAHFILALIILVYFWRLIWVLNKEIILIQQSSADPGPGTSSSSSSSTFNSSSTFSTTFAKPTEKGAISEQPSPIAFKQKNPIFTYMGLILNSLLFILIIQIIYGAFVAGLRAGYIVNTFPDMQGHFFPAGGMSLFPKWVNFFENPLTVQWVHRILGWLLILGGVGLSILTFFIQIPKPLQRNIFGLNIVILIQFILGVSTLLLRVPLPLAVLHQVGAAILLLYLFWIRWLYQERLQD